MRRTVLALAVAAMLVASGCPPEQPPPVPTPGSPPIAVYTGQTFSCALFNDDTVWCWGSNAQGQLGNGTTTSSTRPVKVSGLENVESLALGSAHACAITEPFNGTPDVKCWGANNEGQVGIGSTEPFFTTPQTLPRQARPWGSVWAGFNSTCADTAGSIPSDVPVLLFCWGDNNAGKLGVGTPYTPRYEPEVSFFDGPAATFDVGLGDLHSCLVSFVANVSGRTWCAGQNVAGEFGDGFPTGSTLYGTWQSLEDLNGNFRKMYAGTALTCRHNTSNGNAGCYGSNNAGQFADGTTTDSDELVFLPGTYRSISTTAQTVCGQRLPDLKFVCGGRNQFGQVGDGTTSNRTDQHVLPLDPAPILSGSTISDKIAAGWSHTCAVALAGSEPAVYCWGQNQYGQIGQPLSTAQATTPQRVPGI